MGYRYLVLLASCLVLASNVSAADIPLTLQDALVRTTQQALDLQIERLTPQKSF